MVPSGMDRTRCMPIAGRSPEANGAASPFAAPTAPTRAPAATTGAVPSPLLARKIDDPAQTAARAACSAADEPFPGAAAIAHTAAAAAAMDSPRASAGVVGGAAEGAAVLLSVRSIVVAIVYSVLSTVAARTRPAARPGRYAIRLAKRSVAGIA